MDTKDFDELAGRIEGIAKALLRLTAALEQRGVIDGHQLSIAWRDSVPAHTADTPLRAAARKTLQELALSLDDARRSRQLQGCP